MALVTLVLTGAAQSGLEQKLFTPEERSRLERERDVVDRMDTYRKVCQRYVQRIGQDIRQSDYQRLAETLDLYIDLINKVAAELDAFPFKKGKKLKRFEITMRENLDSLQNWHKIAPLELSERLGRAVELTENLRRQSMGLVLQLRDGKEEN